MAPAHTLPTTCVSLHVQHLIPRRGHATAARFSSPHVNLRQRFSSPHVNSPRLHQSPPRQAIHSRPAGHRQQAIDKFTMMSPLWHLSSVAHYSPPLDSSLSSAENREQTVATRTRRRAAGVVSGIQDERPPVARAAQPDRSHFWSHLFPSWFSLSSHREHLYPLSKSSASTPCDCPSSLHKFILSTHSAPYKKPL